MRPASQLAWSTSCGAKRAVAFRPLVCRRPYGFLSAPISYTTPRWRRARRSRTRWHWPRDIIIVLNGAIELRLEKDRRGQLDVWFCQSGSDLVAAEYLFDVLVNTIRRVRIVAGGVMWSPVKVRFPRALGPSSGLLDDDHRDPVAFDG